LYLMVIAMMSLMASAAIKVFPAHRRNKNH
jgi:hypothetical protein